MAQYELSDTVRANIMKIVANADVKGAAAPAIMEIVQALKATMPMQENGEPEKKE